MLQQLYESAGTPYLLDRGLGCRSTKEPNGRCKVRFFMACLMLPMNKKLVCSFIQQSWLITCQELGTGMSFCQLVFQTGWKCPECTCRRSHCISEPSFLVWSSACWGPGRKPSTEETEGRVTCCFRFCSHLALTAITSDSQLHLGLAILMWGISVLPERWGMY